jgi:hypothetical protein
MLPFSVVGAAAAAKPTAAAPAAAVGERKLPPISLKKILTGATAPLIPGAWAGMVQIWLAAKVLVPIPGVAAFLLSSTASTVFGWSRVDDVLLVTCLTVTPRTIAAVASGTAATALATAAAGDDEALVQRAIDTAASHVGRAAAAVTNSGVTFHPFFEKPIQAATPGTAVVAALAAVKAELSLVGSSTSADENP